MSVTEDCPCSMCRLIRNLPSHKQMMREASEELAERLRLTEATSHQNNLDTTNEPQS